MTVDPADPIWWATVIARAWVAASLLFAVYVLAVAIADRIHRPR